MTNSIREIPISEAFFVIGSNTTENHPVIGAMIKKAVIRGGKKLVVADPRRIELARYADVFLQIRPGTNIALLKDSSLISAIGLAELAYTARTVAGAYSRYWEPYLTISLMYWILTLGLAWAIKRLETRYGRGDTR